MVFDSVSYKNVISNGLVLDKNGQKMSKRLGNAIDPFKTLSDYGPDATRWYMISNSNPWDNLKFDLSGVDEVKRKFFGTLYNTYSFFALYANIDNFRFKICCLHECVSKSICVTFISIIVLLKVFYTITSFKLYMLWDILLTIFFKSFNHYFKVFFSH